jgi:palmitoyltransferase
MSIQSPRNCCYATLKFVPVFFILAVVGWSYYAYVVQMCIRKFEWKIFSICYEIDFSYGGKRATKR